MKRKVLLSLFVCLIFTLSMLSAFAQGYNLHDAKISITLDDSLYVFTKDISPDDAKFQNMGISYEALMSDFNAYNYNLYAMDFDKEYSVSSVDSGDISFYDLSSDALYKAVVNEQTNIQKNALVYESDILEHPECDFIKVKYKDNETNYHLVNYITIYNGKKITISLKDTKDEITPLEDESFEKIIEEIKFLEPKVVKEEPANNTEKPSEIKEETPLAQESKSTNKDLQRYAVIFLIAIVFLSVVAFVLRIVFTNGGLGHKGAKIFAFFYTIIMTFVFYYLSLKLSSYGVSVYYTIVPLIWSVVVYRIVRYR